MSLPTAHCPTQPLRLAAAGTRARLSFYPPGLRQPVHFHEQAHVSIIVAGAIQERRAGREETGFASSLMLRPHETRHEVQFGPEGALVLVVDVADRLARAATKRWIYRDLSRAPRACIAPVAPARFSIGSAFHPGAARC